MKHWDVVSMYNSNGDVISIKVKDKHSGNINVSFKWDGCIDWIEVNDENEEPDYIHICNVDDMIEKLQEIKNIALNNFGKYNEWDKS